MKNVLLFAAFALLPLLSWGQSTYPLVDISDVQYVSLFPDTCNDSSSFALSANIGDTIRITGVVMMNGTASQAKAGVYREIFLQQAPGIWNSIDVFGYSQTYPTDLLTSLAGDSLMIVGTVEEYDGETEFVPDSVYYLGSGNQPITPTVHTIAEFNSANQVNYMTSGEQWEGTYIEFRNCTVVSVTNTGRVDFVITDSSGGLMYVYDRFLAQRTSAYNGTFVAPNVGDQFDYIRGVMSQYKTSCASGYYELEPFQTSDYGYGKAYPAITGIKSNYVTPTASEDVTITATIASNSGIASATLYYAIGVGSTTWNALPMVNTSGKLWSGTIPAQPDSSLIMYFVSATDASPNHLTDTVPTISKGANPYFYIVNSTGTSIYDVQYTPFSNGTSGLVNDTVTIWGVVTASSNPSANDLGYTVIQQPGLNSWGGIWLSGDASLTTLNRGDIVSVTGTVQSGPSSPAYGYTSLIVTSFTKIGSGGVITPVTLDPSVFTKYSFAINKQYEGMLVTLQNGNGTNPLYVVNPSPSDYYSFGQYLVGDSLSDPNSGTRIVAGGTPSSGDYTSSSVNVSYVQSIDYSNSLNGPAFPAIIVDTTNTISSITGIVGYDYDQVFVLPRNNADFVNFQVLGVTAVQSAIVTSDFTVYPNPANSELNISLNSAISGATVTVSDLTGRPMMSQAMTSTSASLDVTSLSSGMYFISISSGSGIVNQAKFIVKK